MTGDPLRRSTYLSLALACAALGYTEFPLFPEVGVFAAVVVVALAVIYRLETRVRLLSIPDANRLGGAIAVACIGWAAFRIAREYHRSEFTGLGWPLFLVCLIGMVLLAAIPAKLLRRDKHAGDYWQLFAAGLGAAVLAGAMAEDAIGFALLGAYAVAGVWALTAFHAARAAGRVPPVPGPGRPAPEVVALVGPGYVRRQARPLAWAAVAAAIAVPLYLVTPRSTFGKLGFAKERVEIGYAADQMVDLTRTGDLKPNTEEAFTVRAEDVAGRPKDDLDPDQRWRGAVLTHYQRGSWKREDHVALPSVQYTARTVRPWRPPDFGPGRVRLTFAVPTRLRSEFLADPVFWSPALSVPVADLTPGGPVGWYVLGDGSFIRPPGERRDGAAAEYVQYTRPPVEPDLGPGFITGGGSDRVFVTNPVPRVKEYADEVIRAGVRAGRLPKAVGELPPAVRPPDEFQEAIAREFARHLAETPDLRYTTAVRRGNMEVDPVEDFLFHTKAGHCERFASALVLMLRSQGIASVLVLGFKGCDPAGDGRYVVRQEFAHAWAEALISRPPPPGVRAARVWHWLSLDPTPVFSSDPTPDAAANGLLGRARNLGRAEIDKYLVNYTPERRDEALGEIGAFARRPAVFGPVVGLAALGLVVWGVRRRPARRPSAQARPPGWYDDLLAVLAAHGYAPAPADTPREFAANVGDDLRRHPATAIVADLPSDLVEGFYRERFGGHEAPDGFRADTAGRLAALSSALGSRR